MQRNVIGYFDSMLLGLGRMSKPHNVYAKVLIVRFSSWGDIVHVLGVPTLIKSNWTQAEIHWATREDFSEMVRFHPHVTKVWSISRGSSLWSLLQFSLQLRSERFTHIYDAHSNLRSHILVWVLRGFGNFLPFLGPKFIRRSKERLKRLLLFSLRINRFMMPYKVQFSYLDPLNRWNMRSLLPQPPQVFFSPEIENKVKKMVETLPPFICLVPSAAWNMKRWPRAHWKRLIHLLPDHFFAILGGPEDHFCQEFREVDPRRVVSFVGQMSHLESAAVLSHAQVVVAADTGLLHVADQLGVPTIALIGPTAFGFPSRLTTHTLEVDLPCRPCSKDGRGKCKNSLYKRCMVEISPDEVAETVKRLMDKVPL